MSNNIKYWYRINMLDFWDLDSSIIEVISQKHDKTEILIQTTTSIETPLQTFSSQNDFINYANANDFWNLDEMSLLHFYIPEIDEDILKGNIA